MDLSYTKPVKQAKQITKPVREKPFIVPEDGGDAREYVTGLLESAPIEYVTLGGINFEKKVLPPDASLTENAGKQFFPRRIVRLFTEKQAKAIREEAEKHIIFLPRRKNPSAEKDFSQPAFLQEAQCFLSEFLICEPLDGFDERKALQKKEVKSGSNRAGNSSNK